MAQKNTPQVLKKSRRYPTYQLYTKTANKKIDPETQLVICALTVLEWIRTKLQEHDIPAELQLPGPADYSDVKITDLGNVHFGEGYTIEIASIPEDKMWSFCLVEPDLSFKWESGQKISAAVPGRMIETNIAFHVVNNDLQCGFKIIVSEPEDTETRSPVLRPTVVRELAMNKNVGLNNGYCIDGVVKELNTKERIKQFSDYIQTGTLSAVVFCDPETPTAKTSTSKFSPLTPPPKFEIPKPSYSSILGAQNTPVAEKQEKPQKSLAFDVERANQFADWRLGYVHAFRLPTGQFETLLRKTNTRVRGGDILFFEGKYLGGGQRVFHYDEGKADAVFSEIMALSQNCPGKYEGKFGDALFLPDVKKAQIANYKRTANSVDEIYERFELEKNIIHDKYKEIISQKDTEILNKAEKITRLRTQIENKDVEIADKQAEADEKVKKKQSELDAMRDKMEYLESKEQRPKTPKEVPEWVEKRFQGRLVFHDKAVKLIKSESPENVDMALLCDALEYLAKEYRDQLTGKIDRDEAQTRCADKYHRPFEVTPCGDTATQMYSSEYKIKYSKGYKGKPVESVLDQHLKCGNTNGKLIRIYFLFDKENRLIVVGSLPKHLSVSSFNA